MRFEKWQALGNDYLIIEESELPWPLDGERVRTICHRNLGPGADGILLLAKGDGEAVASLRIFNPDGSEASLSGNGARGAAMYLHHRGWTELETFVIDTKAGPVRPTIIDHRTCSMELGRAALSGPDWPDGPSDGRGEVEVHGSVLDFQFVDVGNPQMSIEIGDRERLASLDLSRIGPDLESDPRFPNRTNVSFWTRSAEGIEARIFERGVGETLSSGTGASGAAVAACEAGVGHEITVRLDGGELLVRIGSAREIELTGWAVPVYTAELDSDMEERLS